MIINNKTTNVLGYSLSAESQKDRDEAQKAAKNKSFDPQRSIPARPVGIPTGVTGNHPKELLQSPAFQSDVESGNVEVICEDSTIDKTRDRMNISEQVKIPDFDVVDFCTKTKPDQVLVTAATKDSEAVYREPTEAETKAMEKKQMRVIDNLFKLPTLREIEKRERRSNIIQAIERQFKAIETSTKKDKRAIA
jgi:hypothetical protein